MDLTGIPIHKILESSPEVGTEVIISAWAKQVRFAGGGKILFLHLGDGQSTKTLQVVYDIGEEEVAVTFESSVKVTGTLVESPAAGQTVEIKASKVELIGGCDQDVYPFVRGKKAKPMDFLRKYSHLRPKTQVFGAIMRVRDTLSYATIKFFQEHDFYWIHTPILTTSDCEGAGEAFKVTVDKEPKFFREQQAYLTVSGQLQLEPFACALSKVFVFGPSFRAEKSTTSRHLSEFWMLEPEVAFADLDVVVKLAEDYIQYTIKYCLEHRRDEIEFLARVFKKPDLLKLLEETVMTGFSRVSYTDAVEILAKCGRKFQKESVWGVDFGSDQERYLCEEHFKKPTFITHYPSKIKAFYMYEDPLEDKRTEFPRDHKGSELSYSEPTVACMDLLMPGIGEVVGGSQREHRLEILEKKIADAGLEKEQYQYYLDTRRFGSVPHSGFGVGFDRLLRFITGVDHIMDVVPYPVRYEHI